MVMVKMRIIMRWCDNNGDGNVVDDQSLTHHVLHAILAVLVAISL